jgi:hypothetical protein
LENYRQKCYDLERENEI